MTSHGLGTTGTNGAILAASNNVPDFGMMLGSKPIPENGVYVSKEALGRLNVSLGIASARDETTAGGLTYDFSKWIGGSTLSVQLAGSEAKG